MHAVDTAGAAEARALRQFLVEVFVEQLLDLHFDLVGQLEAVRAEQFDAVVLERLCEAEIMTPRSARIDLVSIATAGVGIGPSSSTSMPTEVKPATKAYSIM